MSSQADGNDARCLSALRALYLAKIANSLQSRVATFCQEQIGQARSASAIDQSDALISLPSQETQNASAQVLRAVRCGDGPGIARGLQQLRVFAFCAAQDNLLDRLELLARGVIGRARLIPLVELAIFAIEYGVQNRAKLYVTEALSLCPGPSELHDLHNIQGILALESGDVVGAKEHLSASIKACRGDVFACVTCSARVPNLMLVNKLVGNGEHTAAVRYLLACEEVWQAHKSTISSWVAALRSGRFVDFDSFAFVAALNDPATKIRALLVRAHFLGSTIAPHDPVRAPAIQRERLHAEFTRMMKAAIEGKLEHGNN